MSTALSRLKAAEPREAYVSSTDATMQSVVTVRADDLAKILALAAAVMQNVVHTTPVEEALTDLNEEDGE